MLPQELSASGIDRLLEGEVVILQIISSERATKKFKNESIPCIYVSLSDGFSYFEKLCLIKDEIDESTLKNSLVKISLSDSSLKKFKSNPKKEEPKILINPETFEIISKHNKIIGCPIVYKEFTKNGKVNAKGSNKILEDKEESDTDEDILEEVQKEKEKLKRKQNLPTVIQKEPEGENSRLSNRLKTPNAKPKGESLVKREESINHDPSKKVEQTKKNMSVHAPLGKSENKKTMLKLDETSNTTIIYDRDKIRDLFDGMESFRLVARLLFIWPIRLYKNKKGVESELLNMEFADDTGTIMCTVFGENSHRYCNLTEDNIYSIEGATVVESSFKGVHERKLTFGDGTKVNPYKNEESGIPHLENFCLSLKDLNECEKGKSVTVKCLVKQGEMTEFVSKIGNKIKKKTLNLFDIDYQIECELTLMNEKAEIEYTDGMYALKGVEVDEYLGKKQFKGSLTFLARNLKSHALNRRIKEIDELTFTCIGSNSKQQNKQSINSFSVLNEKSEDLILGESLWSEVICYLRSVRLGNSTNFYLGCPFCKKKISNESATDCPHCHKSFEKPKYRYLLSLNFVDDHDNIWVSAYDEGEKVMALPNEEVFTADSFAECNGDEIRLRISSIRFKRMKLKIVSGKEEYNNQVRVKHKIIKVLPLSFDEENRKMLEKIKVVTSSI